MFNMYHYMINKIFGLNYYESDIDQFLRIFDLDATCSVSQNRERKKYAHIYRLRDQVAPQEENNPPSKLWTYF